MRKVRPSYPILLYLRDPHLAKYPVKLGTSDAEKIESWKIIAAAAAGAILSTLQLAIFPPVPPSSLSRLATEGQESGAFAFQVEIWKLLNNLQVDTVLLIIFISAAILSYRRMNACTSAFVAGALAPTVIYRWWTAFK